MMQSCPIRAPPARVHVGPHRGAATDLDAGLDVGGGVDAGIGRIAHELQERDVGGSGDVWPRRRRDVSPTTRTGGDATATHWRRVIER